ncbi:MAG: phosphoenolpyruvate synthase, partial [Muribaculaceae bacterium]|nr:phosphoenolpyruvate synthase [Muribaculaceae bacterium]
APEDGVVEMAVGLGKYIVDGGRGLRFSPRHADHVLQTSTLELALRDTQTRMMALRPLSPDEDYTVAVDEGENLVTRNVQDFAGTGALRHMVSTYDFRQGCLVDYDGGQGRRVVTFANILRDKALPVAEALDFMLCQGQTAMQRPIEIEFAADISGKKDHAGIAGHMYWLQIRPIIDRKMLISDDVLLQPDSELILRSETALGNGMIEGVRTLVYVKPDTFDSIRSSEYVPMIRRINSMFQEKGEGYLLVGPGRWGSSDPSLGIPVRWADISAARVIVEASLPGYRIEPSQGTHFFQNLTSFGVGYLTVDPDGGNGFYDTEYLDSMPAVYEDEYIRVVEFPEPLRIAINGRSGLATVVKPGFNTFSDINLTNNP